MIAESFERIHRSNLVGMGLVPLQFLPGQNAETLGLSGKESYSINLPKQLTPGQNIQVCFLVLIGFHKIYFFVLLGYDG